MRAIGNIKFDISFSCIREQHIATITMNPKRVHFCSGFSNSLLGILRNCWVSSNNVVSDVYSFAKEIRNDYETQTALPGTMTSVSRTDFSQIYRQIRQVFGSKSRKIRQFLPTFNGKIHPLLQNFQVLLYFYALIFFRMENSGQFKKKSLDPDYLNNFQFLTYFH